MKAWLETVVALRRDLIAAGRIVRTRAMLLAATCGLTTLLGVAPATAQWVALPAPGQSVLNTSKEPTVLAVAKNARLLITGLKDSKSVAFYNPDTGVLLGTTALPKEAIAVALSNDGSRAYALYENDISIAVINTATRAVISTWKINGEPVEPDSGAGQGMALDSARGELYVLDKDDKRVLVISTTNGAVLRSKTLSKKPELISLGAGTSVLVGQDDGQLLVLDPITLSTARTISLGEDLRALSWWQGTNGSRALAVTRKQDALAIVNTATGQISRVPLSDKAEGVEVEQQDNWAYVSAKDDDTLTLIDLVRQALTGYYTLPGPTGNMFFDAASGTLYVTLTKDNKLMRLDPHQASLIRKIGVQKTLVDVAVNQLTQEAVAVSDKDPDFARIKLADRSVVTVTLPDKPVKVAVDSAANVAIVGDSKKRIRFINLASNPPVAFAQQITLEDDVEAIAVDSSRNLTIAAAKGEKRIEFINNLTRSLSGGLNLADKVRAMALHAGKGVAYIATDDKRLRLVNLSTRSLGQVLTLSFEVEGIAVDEALNLAVLVTKDNDRAHLLDLNTLQWVSQLTMPKNPIAVAIQPDSHMAVVVSKDKDLLSLINLETRTVTPEFNKLEKPTAVAVSTRYNQALVVSSDKDALTLVQLPARAPTITSLSPIEVFVGDAALNLTINGTQFIDGSTVEADGVELVTVWVSSTRLTATVPAEKFAQPGTLSIRVRTPGPGGGLSAAASLPVKHRVPVLSAVAPDSALANNQPKTFTLTGQYFVAPMTVLVGAQEYPASISSSTAAVASLPGTLFAVAGSLSLTVKTPGGTSNAKTITLTAPAAAPYVYTSAPATLPATGQAREITLSGYNFVSGAQVLIGSQSFTTSFVNSQNLRFNLPASLTAQAANLVVKVRNPDGQASNDYLLSVVAPDLVVAALSPERGEIGTLVSVYGAGFSTNAADNQVRFAGNVLAAVQSASLTELKVLVPAGAQTGALQVAVGPASATGPVFTVGATPAEDFAFGVNAGEISVLQGASAAVNVQLNNAGSDAFTGLALLGITGLPAGVTAEFDRPNLAAGQRGTLRIFASSAAAIGISTVNLTASGKTAGGALQKSIPLRLNIKSGTGVTGVKGRFVDPAGNGIGGVLVRFDPLTGPGLSPIQVQSDSAGNFTLTGVPSGEITLRFDATPAHPLFPIWPFLAKIEAGKILQIADWTLNPPPSDDKFTPINNQNADQQITDPRFPGVVITLPQGVTITGYDGIKKTRIAVERVEPDKAPVPPPPVSVGAMYQMYFGTPMGGIPSSPIPITLPNEAGLAPGEQTELFYFDGSPMGGEGEWKIAGMGTVSADGKTIVSDPGVGVPRFCGVCGLVCFASNQDGVPQGPCPTCPKADSGDPVLHSTGQGLLSVTDMVVEGDMPIVVQRHYNPYDAFAAIAKYQQSLGVNWTLEYDVALMPFNNGSSSVRVVMPGNSRVNFARTDTSTLESQPRTYVNRADTRFRASTMRSVLNNDPVNSSTDRCFAAGSNRSYSIEFDDGTTWQFGKFPGATGVRISGGCLHLLTGISDTQGRWLAILRNARGTITGINSSSGGSVTMRVNNNNVVDQITDMTGRVVTYTHDTLPDMIGFFYPNGRPAICDVGTPTAGGGGGSGGGGGAVIPLPPGVTIKGGNYNGTPKCLPGGTTTSVSAGASRAPSGSGGGASVAAPASLNGGTVNVGQAPDVPITPQRIRAATTPYGQHSYVFSEVPVNPDDAGECTADAYTGARLASITRPDFGGVVTNTYGFSSRVISQQLPDGGQYKFAYKLAGACVTIPGDPKKRCTGADCPTIESAETLGQGYRFHGGRVLETIVTDPLGRKTTQRFVYNSDAQGHVSAQVDALGQDWRFDRDAYSNITFLKDPLGRVTRNVYDGKGNRIATADPGNRLMEFTYSATLNRLTSMTRYLGAQAQTWQFDYNAGLKRLSLVRDPLNQTTELRYINGGRLTEVVDALTNKTSFGYTPQGNLSTVTDGENNATTATYDARGRLKTITDPLSNTTEFGYDAVSNLKTIKDALTNVTRMDYSSRQNLERVIDPRYAEADTNATPIERYTHDPLNRVTTITDATGAATTIVYDTAGNVRRVTDRKSRDTHFDYDALNRVTEIRHPDATTQYDYDAVGRVTEVRETGSQTSTHRYRYDNVDRLVEETSITAAGSHKIEYRYDDLDRLTRRTVTLNSASATPNAPEVTEYSYDLANRLKTITYRGETTKYEWDAANRLTDKTLPNGIVQAYGYDKANRLTSIEYKKPDPAQPGNPGAFIQIDKITYGYDPAGRRTTRTTVAPDSLIKTQPETFYTANYDAANRMTDITLKGVGAGNTDVTYVLNYDSAGNLTTRTGGNQQTVYTWDGRDRLIKIETTQSGNTTPILSATFKYDALNRRIERTITQGSNPAVTTRYVYDGMQAVAELRPGQTQTQDNTTHLLTGLAIDEMIARYSTQGGTTESRKYLTDALGTTLALAKDDKTLATAYGYSAYGETQASGEASANDSEYTARENDGTGLYYYRARYYDPVLKRFIAEDPIGLEAGLNTTSYVSGDPIQYIDPDGLQTRGGGRGQGYIAREVAIMNAQRLRESAARERAERFERERPGREDREPPISPQRQREAEQLIRDQINENWESERHRAQGKVFAEFRNLPPPPGCDWRCPTSTSTCRPGEPQECQLDCGPQLKPYTRPRRR